MVAITDSRMSHPRSVADLTTEEKNLIGSLWAEAGDVENGRATLRELFTRLDLSLSEPLLATWSSLYRTRGESVKRVKLAGHEPVLNDDEKRLVVGKVLDMNLKDDRVSLDCTIAFVRERLGKELSKPTMSRYLHAMGFSMKKMKSKVKGFQKDYGELAVEYSDFIQHLRSRFGELMRSGPFGSIDFTFTKHSATSQYSYSLKGRCVISKT